MRLECLMLGFKVYLLPEIAVLLSVLLRNGSVDGGVFGLKPEDGM